MESKKRLIDANALMQNGWHLTRTGESNRFLASMSLADVPVVDAVEVVHGRWKKHEATGFLGCSNCWDVFVEEDWLTKDRWNYCPKCGAKMDGERRSKEE